MLIQPAIKGIRQLQKDMAAYSKEEKRALNTAIKVEAFRRLRELRDQLRQGIPGGHPYAAQLSELARRTKSGRLRKNQVPLYRLARIVRYEVTYKDGDLSMSFGFTGGKLSRSWKDLVIKHAEGTRAGLDAIYSGSRTELGIRFARIGGRLKKQGDPDAKYFFLRKHAGRRLGAFSAKLPKRPTVEPYFEANKAAMLNGIRANFRRKLDGERI